MKRIDTADYEESMRKVRDRVECLRSLPLLAVEVLWQRWSEDEMYAGHLVYSDDACNQFEAWLNADVKQRGTTQDG